MGRKKYFLYKNDILFIEVQNKQCIVHTKSERIAVNKTLEEINKQLSDDFIRVHRSYIINVKQIKSIQKVWDRTYEIDFFDYPYKAHMSRNEYQKTGSILPEQTKYSALLGAGFFSLSLLKLRQVIYLRGE